MAVKNLYEVYTMTNVKMTEREILNAVIDGTIDTDVLVEYAEKRIAQLDKRNASAKVRAEKKRAEADELTEKVFDFVTAEGKNRAVITAEVNEALGLELTEAKVGAKLTALAKAGRISKEKGKVEGADGKMKEAILYFIG